MIHAVYAISQSEFSEAQKIWCSREIKKLPGRWLVQGVSILVGGFIGWSFKYLPPWLVLALSGSLLLLVVVSAWRRKAIRIYQFTLNAERLDQVEIWMDDSGYRDQKLEVCGGWIAWKSFTGWGESANIFVLGRNLSFVTVPKRALAPTDQEELRTMLSDRFGSKV